MTNKSDWYEKFLVIGVPLIVIVIVVLVLMFGPFKDERSSNRQIECIKKCSVILPEADIQLCWKICQP